MSQKVKKKDKKKRKDKKKKERKKEKFLISTHKSKYVVNLQNLNYDIMKIIHEYTFNDSLFDSCKELHKLKKKFLIIQLNTEKTVRFFKESKYRDHIYSLIDYPKKQLILNIDDYSFDKKRSLYFIFNEAEDFYPQYLDILNNVYLYVFSNLSLNHGAFYSLTRDKFNKKYLNFTSLDVNIFIINLEVNNVEYDIDKNILNKKNIQIQNLSQTYDDLCTDDSKQYDLYEKLKKYSEKYSINFKKVDNTRLSIIIYSHDSSFTTDLILYHQNRGVNYNSNAPRYLLHNPSYSVIEPPVFPDIGYNEL